MRRKFEDWYKAAQAVGVYGSKSYIASAAILRFMRLDEEEQSQAVIALNEFLFKERNTLAGDKAEADAVGKAVDQSQLEAHQPSGAAQPRKKKVK